MIHYLTNEKFFSVICQIAIDSFFQFIYDMFMYSDLK